MKLVGTCHFYSNNNILTKYDIPVIVIYFPELYISTLNVRILLLIKLVSTCHFYSNNNILTKYDIPASIFQIFTEQNMKYIPYSKKQAMIRVFV